MSRKNTLEFPAITAQSLGADFTTPVTQVNMLDNCSYQIDITTSDSTGSFTVEVSNDYNVNLPTNALTDSGTWGTLPIGGTPVVASANDTIFIDINQISFKAMRIRYTAGTPGTGVCDIKLIAKSIGA